MESVSNEDVPPSKISTAADALGCDVPARADTPPRQRLNEIAPNSISMKRVIETCQMRWACFISMKSKN